MNKFIKFNFVSIKRRKIPWSKLLTSIPMWALLIAHFGNNWGLYTILTLLPTYFQKILLLDIKSVRKYDYPLIFLYFSSSFSLQNGLISSLPWLLSSLMGWIAGVIADKVRSTNKFSINIIRKVSNSIGKLFIIIAPKV